MKALWAILGMAIATVALAQAPFQSATRRCVRDRRRASARTGDRVRVHEGKLERAPGE